MGTERQKCGLKGTLIGGMVRRNSDPSLALSNIVTIGRSPQNGQFLWEATHQITCYTSKPGCFGELRKIRVKVSQVDAIVRKYVRD